MSLATRLTPLFAAAFDSLGFDPSFGAVVPSQRPELGQFQCNGALPAAGRAKQKPRDVAQAVIEALPDRSLFKELSLAGPGFINIVVSDELLAEEMRRLAADERLGYPRTAHPERVMVDFGGANAAKEMHVGHLRASIIGDSIQKLFRFRGDMVMSDIHLGDWGLQMGQLIAGIRQQLPDLPYFDPAHSGPYPDAAPLSMADFAEIYPAASARSREEPAFREEARQITAALQAGHPGYRALWEQIMAVSIAALKRDYEALGGIEFDYWFGESTVNELIPPMVEALRASGHAIESEGALIIEVEEPTDKKEMPPLILLSRSGAALYGTSDLATIQQRVEEFGAERLLYVVDQRQAQHFEQLFRAARKTGIAGDAAMEHLGFGTMNGKDGRPFKTREGGVMLLSDLIQMVTDKAHERLSEIPSAAALSDEERATIARQVGLAALKYADLSNHRTSDYIFDLDKFSAFEGRTGPYLLYSAVRVKSILRRAAEQALGAGTILPPTVEAERELMLKLDGLAGALDRTIEARAPNHLAEYAFELALAFNRFYNACHILSEGDAARQGSWLALSALTLRALELIAGLLGLEIPERM